jgi:tetratricopeptide (TPR) repeat protein
MAIGLALAVVLAPARWATQPDPSVAAKLYKQAYTPRKQKQYEQAAQLYRQVLEHEPDHIPGWFHLGYCLLKLEANPEAIHCFDRVIKARGPHYALALQNRASGLADLGRWREAEEDLSLALQLRHDDADLWAFRAWVRGQRGDLPGSVSDYTQALEFEPHRPGTHYNRGRAYRRMGRAEEALADWKQAVELDRRDHKALHGIGIIYNDSYRDPERAIGWYNRALEVKPDSAVALASRSLSYAWLDEWDKAEADARRAIAIPDAQGVGLSMAHRTLGNLAWRENRFEDAVEHYSESLRHDPPSRYQMRYWRARAYRRLDQHEEALADFRAAFNDQPHDVDLIGHMASCHMHLGRLQEALGTVNYALLLDGENVFLHQVRGNVLRHMGRSVEVEEALRRAIELEPDDAGNYTYYAKIANLSKVYEKTIDVMTLAVERFPDDWRMYHYRSLGWLATGDYEQAKIDCREAMERDARPARGRGLATIALAAGEPGPAFEAAIEYGKHPEADSYARPYWLTLAEIAALYEPDLKALRREALDRAWPTVKQKTWHADLRRFLRGESSEAALAEAAANDWLSTEMHAVLGLVADAAGDREKAIAHLRWVVEDGEAHYLFTPLAMGTLHRLGGMSE